MGATNIRTILFIIFLVLKLCGVIDWSWWWVTAPIWIPIVLAIIVTLVVALILPGGFKVWWEFFQKEIL